MRRTKLPLRGTPAHARTTAKKPRTQPPKSARGQSIADRETLFRAEASRDAEGLFLRIRHAPQEGHVWVWTPIPKRRFLIEEPVDYRAIDPKLGSVAETGGEA